ncbi:hypothetical protein [Streptomyces hawaiiensis]|uniref:hypothetical protein n=1 Tax=Streptomyces hawaiiensis TaxID=67305 RepID=UPI0015867661|nr:hypothetical protein [Streptomyces hawaiiensis]
MTPARTTTWTRARTRCCATASARRSPNSPAAPRPVGVSTGSHLRVLLATVGTATVWCLLLTAAGLVLPLMFATHTPGLADLALGAAAQLTCAFTGMAIGQVCSPLVFRRQGYALVLALAGEYQFGARFAVGR